MSIIGERMVELAMQAWRGDMKEMLKRNIKFGNGGQLRISDAIGRVELLKQLRDESLITQHDYWLLSGSYRIIHEK